MTSTLQTTWTNRTMELLKGRQQHANARAIPKSVLQATVAKGFRMVSLQTKATEGARHHRLDAWYYIRRVDVGDIWRGLQEEGRSNEVSHQELETAVQGQKVYHVVVRGNDPKFLPPGDHQGADVVTNYFLENLQFVREEVDKYLFDELENPSAICEAMDNPLFDNMLQVYFENGDKVKEETLHLASRFRGGGNLLHACIKEGYSETLDLFLSSYTAESHAQAPWRVLAEPLRAVGQFRVTAFHRAVYDGKAECLRRLVDWSVRNGHDITLLKNVEDRDLRGAPAKELTSLELAEQVGNWECYNILAPLFHVPLREGATDQNTRETRHAAMSAPRIEIMQYSDGRESSVLLATAEISAFTWQQIFTTTVELLSQVRDQQADNSSTKVNICRVPFVDDVSEEIVSNLLETLQGSALVTEGCTMQTDLTMLTFLRAVVERLGKAAETPQISGDAPSGLPHKVDVACRVAEMLPLDDETACDDEAVELLEQFLRVVGRVPGFRGARNGIMSPSQRQRLMSRNDGGKAAAAAWAAVYGTRVSSFVSYKPLVDDGLSEWLRRRELMPLARMISKEFFNAEQLLQREFLDPRDALHPATGQFLHHCLTAWFASFPAGPHPVDPWERWAGCLGVDTEVVQQELAPALDLVLESLLRMSDFLDYNFRRHSSSTRTSSLLSIADLVQKSVPAELLHHRMPYTRAALEASGISGKADLTASRPRLSVLSVPTAFRPGGR